MKLYIRMSLAHLLQKKKQKNVKISIILHLDIDMTTISSLQQQHYKKGAFLFA